MIELEENLKTIKSTKAKLQELGESLWHKCKAKRIKRIRRKDNARRLLDR